MHASTHSSSVGGRFNVSPVIQVSQELPVELPDDSVVTPFVPSFGPEPLSPTRYHRNERLENQVVHMLQMTLVTITLDYGNSLFQNISFNTVLTPLRNPIQLRSSRSDLFTMIVTEYI